MATKRSRAALPSTEVSECIAKYDEVYAEWAPNEKVAFEVAAGASYAGARSMVCMKHVGVNVAADPMFTAAYTGVNGGLVILAADDPGMHSSQNEQDTRFYARSAHIPMFEPADSAEAKEFTKRAFLNGKLSLSSAEGLADIDNIAADIGVSYEDLMSITEGVLDYLNDPSTPERYIRLTPDYYRLFLPLTYYERPIARLSDVRRPSPGPDTLKAAPVCPLWTDTLAFTRQERADEATDRALLAAYLGHMDLVRFTEAQIEAGPTYRDNIEREERSRPSVLKLFKSESMRYVKPDDADVVIHKPNWWVTGGSGSLQFSQSHISDNWYNGGEGTHSLVGSLQLFANYNDREKWQWESLMDAKLGFISAPSDEYHNYLVNNDQLRIASKVGLQAIKNWYYTLHTEFKTQFCNGYGANSQTLSAAFLSPAYWTTGLGMDFKLNKPKATLSVVLSPLTYTMKIVTNPDVDEVSFGLDEGATTAHDFGSQVQANLTWQAFSFLSVTSRFDYLTSYETVRIEWENTFNFILNRYLSAKLYVYGRFDDGVAPAENGSYFQVNENFGFGLNYTW